MSASALAWALAQRTEASPDKLILALLGDCADAEKDGTTAPTIQYLVEVSQLSRSSVKRSLRRLEAGEFITTVGKSDGGATVYKIPGNGHMGGSGWTGVQSDPPSSTEFSSSKSKKETTTTGGSGWTPQVNLDPPGEAQIVWDHYVKVMEPRRKELGREEAAIIRDALKVASVEECCEAITKCSQSDLHMGRDRKSKGKKYNSLSLILKKRRASNTSSAQTTRERIDWWLDRDSSQQTSSKYPSGVARKIWILQDRVRRLPRDDERSRRVIAELEAEWGITTEWTVQEREGHPDRPWPVFSEEVPAPPS